MTNNHSDMTIVPILYVNEKGKVISEERNGNISKGTFSLDYIINKSVDYGGWIYRLTWNKLYHRELFEGVYFIKNKIYEDEFIAYRLLLKCKNISCIDNSYYFYRNAPNSVTNTVYTVKNLNLVEAYLYNCRLLFQKNYLNASRKFIYRAVLEFSHSCNELKEVNLEIKKKCDVTLRWLYEHKGLSYIWYLTLQIIITRPMNIYKILLISKNLYKNIKR